VSSPHHLALSITREEEFQVHSCNPGPGTQPASDTGEGRQAGSPNSPGNLSFQRPPNSNRWRAGGPSTQDSCLWHSYREGVIEAEGSCAWQLLPSEDKLRWERGGLLTKEHLGKPWLLVPQPDGSSSPGHCFLKIVTGEFFLLLGPPPPAQYLALHKGLWN
jgi:hypothetical protein